MTHDTITQILFDQAKCPIAIKNQYLKFTYVNDAYAALYSRVPGDFVGRSLYDFLDRAVASKLEDHEIESFEKQRASYSDEEFLAPNGERTYFSVLTQTIKDGSGHVCLVKIYFDISDHKQRALALEEQLLEHAVFEEQTDRTYSSFQNDGAAIDLNDRRFILFDEHEDRREQLMDRFDAWGIDCAGCQTIDEVLAIMWSMHDMNIVLDGVLIDMESALGSELDIFDQFASDEILSKTPLCLLYRPELAHEASDLISLYPIDEKLKIPIQPSQLLRCLTALIGLHDKNDCDQDNSTKSFSKRLRTSLSKIINHTQTSNIKEQVDILVFETNSIKQIALGKILSSTDYTFKITGDGGRAMRLMELVKPRVFIYDLSIESIDGIRVSNLARKKRGDQDFMPIIGLSDVSEAHGVALERLNINDLVQKPVTAHGLVTVLERWLEDDKRRINHIPLQQVENLRIENIDEENFDSAVEKKEGNEGASDQNSALNELESARLIEPDIASHMTGKLDTGAGSTSSDTETNERSEPPAKNAI